MILQMNIYGSLLIIFTVIIRAAAINKLPKKVFLALWIIITGRLLLPYSMPQIINVYPAVSILQTLSGEKIINKIPLQGEFVQPYITDTDISDNITRTDTSANLTAPAEVKRSISLYTVIWLAGIIALGALFIVPHIIHLRKYREALPVEDDYIRLWVDSHRLRRKYKVMVSDEIASPFTYGLFRPFILLPENVNTNNRELTDYILTHEYIHIKRFDVMLKWVSAVTLCVHWFNPLVWLMYILMNRDIELSCDEGVVRVKGETNKKSYAMALVDMEANKKSFNPLVNNFNKNSLKERVTAIMKIKKTTALSLMLAFTLIITSTVILISSCTNTNIPNEPSEVAKKEIVPTENPEEEIDPYANVRFGETRNILLLDVEWHTYETYMELIDEFKNSFWSEKTTAELMNLSDENKEKMYIQTIEGMGEQLNLIKDKKLYVSKSINGASRRYVIISQELNSDEYYAWDIYPYCPQITYFDETGAIQIKSFGLGEYTCVESKEEYAEVLESQIIPFCDDLLAKGLITQEMYDKNTVEDPLDYYIDLFFN